MVSEVLRAIIKGQLHENRRSVIKDDVVTGGFILVIYIEARAHLIVVWYNHALVFPTPVFPAPACPEPPCVGPPCPLPEYSPG